MLITLLSCMVLVTVFVSLLLQEACGSVYHTVDAYCHQWMVWDGGGGISLSGNRTLAGTELKEFGLVAD